MNTMQRHNFVTPTSTFGAWLLAAYASIAMAWRFVLAPIKLHHRDNPSISRHLEIRNSKHIAAFLKSKA